MRDFELIVVDQNTDDRLAPLLKDWATKVAEQNPRTGGSVTVKYLRSHKLGVSRARNLGILHSCGESWRSQTMIAGTCRIH